MGIDQKLDAQVPADLTFNDENGKSVHLGDYFGRRPIILALVYYKCPMLCTMVLNDLTRSMRGIGTMDVGRDFDVLAVSFDPTEKPDLAAAKKKQYIAEYGRASAADGWHFLTGSQESISRLTSTVGFRYAWDEPTKSYAHSSGIILLTPAGKISRYFFGIDYAPSDLKLSLAEAGQEQIAPRTIDRILLYCFHYDPRSGRYGLAISHALQIGAVLTVLLLGGFIGVSLFKERSRQSIHMTTDHGQRTTDN